MWAIAGRPRRRLRNAEKSDVDIRSTHHICDCTLARPYYYIAILL
jgi:hypothetical protein